MTDKDPTLRVVAMGGSAHETKSSISAVNDALDVWTSREDDNLMASLQDQARLKGRLLQRVCQCAALGHSPPADERVDVGNLIETLRARGDA